MGDLDWKPLLNPLSLKGWLCQYQCSPGLKITDRGLCPRHRCSCTQALYKTAQIQVNWNCICASKVLWAACQEGVGSLWQEVAPGLGRCFDGVLKNHWLQQENPSGLLNRIVISNPADAGKRLLESGSLCKRLKMSVLMTVQEEKGYPLMKYLWKIRNHATVPSTFTVPSVALCDA